MTKSSWWQPPTLHDVGLTGEDPTHTGLLGGDADRAAHKLSQGHFFTPVKKVGDDGSSTTYLFGDEWKPFG